MSQLDQFKKFFDEMNIKYVETDADYFIDSLEGINPSGNDVKCNEGYIQLDLKEYVLGFGFCSLIFAKDNGRFIGVEAE